MKFRSWEKDKKEFVYFEDGVYSRYTGTNGTVKYYENIYLDSTQLPYFWQNAEMGIKVKEFIFFVGDKIDVNYNDIYGHKHNICGVVSFENYEVYINETESRYYSLNDILNASKIVVISNTHEKENN